MKFPVECLLKRPGGTVVDLYGTTYHFKAENDPAGLGRHVCDIPNAKHLQRLMQIPEAYAILDDDPAPAPAPAPVITTPAPVPVNPQAIGVASGPAPDLGAAIAAAPGSGQWSDQNAPVTLAQPVSGDTAPSTPGEANTGAPPVDNGPVTLAPPVDSAQDQQDAAGSAPALPTVAELEAMELDVLREQAAKEVGREPSPRAKKPLLISQIMAARADKAA